MSYNLYNLDGIVTQLKKDRDLCIAKIENAAGKSPDLYYCVKDTVQERYPYI